MFHTESRIFVRFRLDALSNSDVDDGWWIDNIEFRNRPNLSISPNFCDDMEAGSDYWTPGTWALTNEKSYDGQYAWSDSPNGNYNDGSNSSLEFLPAIDLTQPGTPSADHPTLVRPIIEFWHRWEVDNNDHILVELGQYDADDQLVWDEVTPLWSYSYNGPPDSALPNYGTSISGQRFNEQKAWVREVIELTDYIGQKDLFVRFRLDARLESATDDGWY
jgi:hypothetical protein